MSKLSKSRAVPAGLETYEGTCPVCGLTLFVSAQGRVVCLGDDYEASQADFERVWDVYQRLPVEQKEEQADALVGLLVGLNTKGSPG